MAEPSCDNCSKESSYDLEVGEGSMSINDLPTEILAEIFSHLENFSDRNRVAKVCPLWKSVVDETLGLKKWIGNGSDFWDLNANKWKPLMEIRRSGVAQCFVSNLADELGNFSNPEEVGFLRPNLVKRIEFDAFISQEIYERLMCPLKNLVTLAFHVSTLTLLEVRLDRKFCVETLSKLCLTYEGFTRNYFNIYGNDMELVYQNLQSILQLRFPKLTTFESSMPLFLDKELELFCPIANFVKNHVATLECLSLKWNYRWRVDAKNDAPRSIDELHEINDHLNVEIQQVEESLLSSAALKTLIFIIEDKKIVCPTSLGIKAVLLTQKNLTKLYYMCWDYIETPVDLFKNNSQTLKEIGLTIDDLNNPLDCSVFSDCVNLKRLVLEADGEIEFDDIAQAPRLQNSQNLPQSLTYISFRNIFMENRTVDILAKEMRKLKALNLMNIGRMNNLGMTIPCLLWILKESPTIKTLKVKGLNEICFKVSFQGCIFESGDTEDVDASTECSVCDPEAHIDLKCKDKSNYEDGNPSSLLSFDNQIFLEQLFDVTNMGTKYIPLIKKRKGTWSKM